MNLGTRALWLLCWALLAAIEFVVVKAKEHVEERLFPPKKDEHEGKRT